MKRVYATLSIDDIDATLSATPVRDSYDVHGPIEWTTFEDMQVESIAILGVDVDPKALPKELLANVCDLADDWLEESAWEGME